MTIDLDRAARSAMVGDGSFWKHPESRDFNCVFSGTNKSWIQWKSDNLLGGRPVYTHIPDPNKPCILADGTAIQSKLPMYTTKSLVDPLFSMYSAADPIDVIGDFDIKDMAIWYFDDGCAIERRWYKNKTGDIRYRYLLCIGSLCNTSTKEAKFLSAMRCLFSVRRIGAVVRNNSNADKNNRTWLIPVPVACEIIEEAKKLNVYGFEPKLRFNPRRPKCEQLS